MDERIINTTDHDGPKLTENSPWNLRRSKVKVENDLELLKAKHAQREYHHKALWEEEKHFTWLNSLVLSGQLLVFASDKLSVCAQSTLICLLAALGVGLSLLALRVLRSESQNFQEQMIQYVELHNKVFPTQKLSQPSNAANKRYLNLLWDSLRGRQTIRDAFQGVFLLFIVMFAAMAVAFGATNHLKWSLCWWN
jgi:hypothetical protein